MADAGDVITFYDDVPGSAHLRKCLHDGCRGGSQRRKTKTDRRKATGESQRRDNNLLEGVHCFLSRGLSCISTRCTRRIMAATDPCHTPFGVCARFSSVLLQNLAKSGWGLANEENSGRI